MIKWPEPFRKQGQQLCNDGNTTVFFDAYTEAQLKQAVREVLQHAADEIKIEADYSGSNRKAALMWSVEKLRALIKEVE